ncbi:helix-turn-helix domain-containing protein [Paenibacillus illinoisensis]|uniref:helix-turn-helix domain-containing protein n=1 Tax=Paenibacillus illinoisensis TaxID=59845 RepID=UPI0030170610
MNEQLPFISETSTLPLLSSMCRVRRGENFRVHGKTVSRPMLCLVLQGEGVLILNDQIHKACAHQLFVLEEGTTIEAASRSGITECILLSMNTFQLKQVRGEWKMISDPCLPFQWSTGPMPVRHEQQMVSRMEQLYTAYQGVQQEHFINIHTQLHELLQYISENRLEANQEKVDPALERSIMYMHRFMGEGISMDQLAKIAGLTPSSYSRSFKKAKDMSPTDYLNGLRIEEAKQQLQQDRCSIKDVAESVGYGNEYYFNRKFKQAVGISPSIYMKREQLRVATASVLGLEHNLASLGLEAIATLNGFTDQELSENEHQHKLTLQFNKLRQSKPDLIIADTHHEPYHDILKSIAPTVLLEPVQDWKQIHSRIAELVGREKQALNHFKQLEFRTLDVGKRLQQFFDHERVTLVEVKPPMIRLQGTINHPLSHLLYTELGLQPAQIAPPEHQWVDYPAERIPLLDTDHLFIHRLSMHPASEKLLRRLKQTSSWNRSPAVLGGNVHDISSWLMMSWTPSGRHRIMDELIHIAEQHAALSHAGLIGQF